MTDEYYELFGLDFSATLDDVKKAYRALAKANHPDRFAGGELKVEKERMMQRINEAYRVLRREVAARGETGATPAQQVNLDYALYKKGVEFYDKYFGSFGNFFGYYTVKRPGGEPAAKPGYRGILQEYVETEKNLAKARLLFEKLLRDYPDSDWAYDSAERLDRIDRKLANVRGRIEDLKLGVSHWTTNKGTPILTPYTDFFKYFKEKKGR